MVLILSSSTIDQFQKLSHRLVNFCARRVAFRHFAQYVFIM